MKLWHGVKKSSGTFFVMEEGGCYLQGTQSITEMGPSECSLRICKCMRRPIITFNPLSSICSACIVYTRMWVVEFLLEIFEMNFTIWSEFSKSKMLVWLKWMRGKIPQTMSGLKEAQERQVFKMQFLKCYIFSVEFCRDSVLGGSEKWVNILTDDVQRGEKCASPYI